MKQSLRLIPSVGAVLLVLGVTLSSSAADSVHTTPLPPVETVDGRAGICYSYYDDPLGGPEHPFIPLAYNAGSRWDRFDFAWPSLEPENGVWDFGPHEAIVQDLHAGGIANIIGILQMTPQWAASECTAGSEARSSAAETSTFHPPGPGALSTSVTPQDSWDDPWTKVPPRGLYEEWNDWDWGDGDAVNYWGRFVYRTVNYYSERGVKHWEMWNEPEWSLFWCGTSAEYARLIEVGYLATKAACADCKVLFGGLHYWKDPTFFERVLDILNDRPYAASNNYYFDVMSVHLYHRSSDIYDKTLHIRSRMKSYVPDHPIWLTETGIPVWGDSYAWVSGMPKADLRATPAEAASFTIQSYANAWASDVERYFFFRAHDDWCDKNHDGDCLDEGDAGMTEPFGLVRDDRTIRPSYTAYQVATRYLISPTMVTNWPYSSGARRVTLWSTPRGKVSVLWNRTPDPIDFHYDATLSTATRVDQRGATQTIDAIGGVYQITLPGATANLVSNPNDYIIGGEPYLIIEEVETVRPSRAVLDPLPATTYSHTIPISWSASDDQSGIWGFDVEVKPGGSGSWLDWLGLAETEGIWSAGYDTGQHNTLYCFRARAWDRVGNVGPWSDEERCTRLDLDREVHLNVGMVFGDANGDGDRDAGESALDNVSFHLVNRFGSDVVPPSTGPSWELTTTLMTDEYALLIEPEGWPSPPPGWLRTRMKINLQPGETTWELDYPTIGLLPHRSSSYLPLVARDS